MMPELFLFSILLNIETFAAAFAIGFRSISVRRSISYAFCSAFAGGSAVFLGFILALVAKGLTAHYENVIACGLLVAVGAHMCWEAYHHSANESSIARGLRSLSSIRILFTSTITSLDNFAVGFSLGLAGKSISVYSLAIGVAAFFATCLGLRLAKWMPPSFGVHLEILGGLVLMTVGLLSLRA